MNTNNVPVRWPLHLWNRKKEVDVQLLENGNFVFEARLDDTLSGQQANHRPHKMLVEMELSPDLVVVRTRGEMPVRPYPECTMGADALERLVGVQVKSGVTQEVLRRIGGIQGCSHLLSLVLDVVNLAALMGMVRIEYFAFPDPNIPEEARLKLNLAEPAYAVDRCIAINDQSPVVARVRAQLDPEMAALLRERT